MSEFDISGLEYGASNDEVVDALARLQKQLEFMMNGNLGSKNIREVGDFLVGHNSFMARSGTVGISSLVTGANDVRFWAGNVTPTSAPFRVYEDGLMVASNADIAGKITALLGAIGGWVIGETSLMDAAGTVGLSSAVTAGNDVRMWAGGVTPASAPFRVHEDGSIALTGKNASIMINEWGMNPDFVKRFPNKVVNSGFEWYDSVTLKPLYWDTSGVVTLNSNWDGTVALKLKPSQYAEQGEIVPGTPAGADPVWWSNTPTRVSLRYKSGPIRVKVLKVSDSTAYTLTDNSGATPVTGLFLDYPSITNWENGYISFYFTPTVGAGRVKIRVENNDASLITYVDAVQIEPDFTGRWPSLYSPGPRSFPMNDLLAVPDASGIYYGLDAQKPRLNAVLTSFIFQSSGIGYRFSDNSLWSVDISSSVITKLNPVTGAVLDSWSLGISGNKGCEIDGDNNDIVWTTVGVSGVKKYQISTMTNLSTFIIGASESVNGIAAPPGNYLWVGEDVSPYSLKKINKSDGAIVSSYPLTYQPSGVAWDGINIWVSHVNSSKIQAFDPITGAFAREFIGPSSNQAGLTFDGIYFFVADYSTQKTVSKISEGLDIQPKIFYATDTRKVYWNVNGVWVFVATDTFVGLTDTPDVYTGQAGKAVVVKTTEDGLEFGQAQGSRAISFYLDGVLVVEANAMSFVAPASLIVSLVRLAVDIAPTGADLIIDIHKNGLTLFATQANRPRIIAGASSGISVAPDVTSIVAGDKITLEIDQVGITTAGENLSVSIVCTQV